MLYLESDDDLQDLSPKNNILKRGVSVYIGLDKSTKLSEVFQQYCNFVNSKVKHVVYKSHYGHVPGTVKPSDFEFIHCTLLDAANTVETSAMMKNDRIKVRLNRSKERSTKSEIVRQQRESDRKFFKDLRQMLPNSSPEGMGYDVILDCRGKVMDERGFSQNVLATTVRANSVILSKRCKWLGLKIYNAKEEQSRREELAVLPYEDEKDYCTMDSDDEDGVVPLRGAVGNNLAGDSPALAAEVEDDDEDDLPSPKKPRAVLKSPHLATNANSVCVPLDHSPEAVKILLEYCYTNRVHSLGQDAFIKASKFASPIEVGMLAAKETGPVAPFRKHEWPDAGFPNVSLHLALAGIALAEEAHMPRLSLMCEIAASQLVTLKNVIDVLSACQLQQQKTGNRLPLLRKAAMLDCVYAHGCMGIDRLYEKPSFKANLEEKRTLVVPSLLEGTVEVLPTNVLAVKDWQKKKDKMETDTKITHLREDSLDKNNRDNERKRWRQPAVISRRVETAFGTEELGISSPIVKAVLRYGDPPPVNYSRMGKRKSRSDANNKPDWQRGSTARSSSRRSRRRGDDSI